MTGSAVSRRRQFVSTCTGLVLGGLAFFLTLLNYGTDLTRTAVAAGIFSHFFDLQGRALLDGELHVADGSLGIEGFVHDGKTYTYFPPWPAILRLPVLMTTSEYDARLTLISMALAWIVFAVILAKLIWLLMPMITEQQETTRFQAVVAAAFLAAASGGSFLTFDASLPWVYHEVYLWAVTGALGTIYWMIRVLAQPDRNAVKWMFIFALIAVGSRATEGWAVSLVVIAVALWMRVPRREPTELQRRHRELWWLVLLAGLVPLAASIAINMAKFDAIYMFPLQDQVWTQISQKRRDTLAANGGSLTGPQFFTTSFMAYLRPDGIRFVDYFPWITLPAEPAYAYSGAVVDQTYRTGSVTAFMPTFMLLMIGAVLTVFRPRSRLALLRFPLVAGVLATGGVMGYGYYSNRYSSDFMPALLLGGAIGTCLVARVLARRTAWQPVVAGFLAVGAVFSISAQMSTGLFAAAVMHRGEPLERYVRWQHELSPEQQARRVTRIDGLPSGGSTDDLAIRGDCDALYIHTGDRYEPWLPVQERDRVLELNYDVRDLRSGDATLLTVRSNRVDRVDVQVNSRRQMRFVVFAGENTARLAWFDPPTTGHVALGIRDRIEYSSYEFESSPGGVVGYLTSVYFDEGQDSLPTELTITEDTEELDEIGLEVSVRDGFPLELCEELASEAQIDLASE